MTPENHLWQAVLLQAVTDATYRGETEALCRARHEADVWIRRGSKDFYQVCNLALIDPDFVRDAYVGGRIDADVLRATSLQNGEPRNPTTTKE